MSKKTNRQKLRNWPWITAGMLVILVVFVGGGTWAALARISGAVIAPGTIAVESKIKTVQHLDGGIVGKIFVRDGDFVKAGDQLIRLDSTAIHANLSIITNNLNELYALKARLKAERDGKKSIIFPSYFDSKSDDPVITDLLQGQRALFEARSNGLQGQAGILHQKIAAFEKEIGGLEAQLQGKKRQAMIISEEIKIVKPLLEKGHARKTRLLALQRQAAQLDGAYGKFTGDIARTRTSIEEIKLQILQLDKEFREKVLTNLRETQTKIADFSERRIALQEQLRRIDIRSPVAGRIHNMAIHTVGGVISPAKPIMQIIPENARLVIESRIQTADVDQVHIGQEASVYLSAFDARTTPILNAKVKKISAAQLVDPATNMPYFTLEIEIPENELLRLNKGQRLLPGMPAEAFIRTGERSPLDYFLKPLMVQIMRAFKEP